MATKLRKGVNYSFNGYKINFFGYEGHKLAPDEQWTVTPFRGEPFITVEPDSIMEDVSRCLEASIKAGNGRKISQLQLAPRQAVVFFLEGKLTRMHLAHATEGVDYVDLPGVRLEGFKLTVRIMANPSVEIAIADQAGNILASLVEEPGTSSPNKGRSEATKS